MVERHPKLLTNNEAMMEKRLVFLFDDLGLSDAAVKRIVQSHPQVLNYTPESMRPRVAFLQQEVGMNEQEVADMVTRLGQLFSLSVENSLRPKFQYLTSELGGGKHSLASYPTYLSLSLEQRIQPRHRFLVERQLAANPFQLHALMSSDVAFAKAAHAPLDDYLSFRERLISGLHGAPPTAPPPHAR